MLKRFSSQSIRRKMMTVFTLVILLPALLSMGLSMKASRLDAQRDAENEARRLLSIMAQDISARSARVEYVASILASNPTVISFVMGKDYSYGNYAVTLGNDIEQGALSDARSYLFDIGVNIMLITANNELPEKYYVIMRESSFADCTEIEKLRESASSCWGYPGWQLPGMHAFDFIESEKTIPYFRKISNIMGDYQGAVKCSVKPDGLFGILKNSVLTYPINVLKNGECIYSTGEVYGKDAKLVTYELDRIGVTLAAMPNRVPSSNILSLVLRETMLIMLFTVVMIISVAWILRRIFAGLDDVKRLIAESENMNSHSQLPVKGNDEIALLFSTINKLLTARDDYASRFQEQEKRTHEAQIFALQCQMNPHFLFNALNWIQLTIETGKATAETSDAIAYLGKVLHYNISMDYISELGAELECVNNYMKFIEIREPGRVHLTYSCPDELLSARCLRFTLQPLVENALRHGSQAEQRLNISIDIRDIGNNVEIAVCNDGLLISENQLEQINTMLEAQEVPLHGGVGLFNLSKRLHIMLQSACVRVANADGCVCVYITMGKIEDESIFDS